MTLIGVGKPSSGSAERVSSRPDPARTRLAWMLLGVLGAVFAVVGLADILLGLYPPSRRPEWEFGAISSILNGLAIPTMGGYLVLSSLLTRGNASAARAVSGLALFAAVLLAILALVYLTVVPLALRSVAGNEVLALAMRKAIVKGVILFVAYIALFVFAGMQGLRGARKN